MCVIVDANVWPDFCSDPTRTRFGKVRAWLESDEGSLVYGGTKYRAEVRPIRAALQLLAEYVRAGRAMQYRDGPIDEEAARIEREERTRSNDQHILALARVSGARILCTDDKKLMSDFKNRELVPDPRGRVYPRNNRRFDLGHHGRCPMPDPV